MASTLVLVRHGQSEWNAKNLFTGWKDVDLTEKGRAEARSAGERLNAIGIRFDLAFTSNLRRAQDTLSYILTELGQEDLDVTRHQALNERDYGELVGLNKDEAREKWGDEQVHIWRRSFDTPPPGGESLKDTADRVLPYFDAQIRPRLGDDRKVIIAAHGNSLRALVMKLVGLSRDEVTQLNLATGVPIIYELGSDLEIHSKRELTA